jgi:hypothetical protein
VQTFGDAALEHNEQDEIMDRPLLRHVRCIFVGIYGWAGKQGGFYDHHRIAIPNHFTLPWSMLPCYHCITYPGALITPHFAT